jgi:hypothetical protein
MEELTVVAAFCLLASAAAASTCDPACIADVKRQAAQIYGPWWYTQPQGRQWVAVVVAGKNGVNLQLNETTADSGQIDT